MLDSSYLKLSHHVCAFFYAQHFFPPFLLHSWQRLLIIVKFQRSSRAEMEHD